MMKLVICLWGAILMTSLGACGGEGGDGDGDGDGDNTSTGGEAGDGDGSGGSGDGDTNGGDGHCSPGDKYESAYAYLSRMENCGVGVGRSIVLPEVLGPGDTYAVSADMGPGTSQTMELWGAADACGEKLELLGTFPMGPGVVCMEVSPQEGTYSHLIWAWNSPSGGHNDVTFCPMGTCGE